jgi:hypothetical protein
MRGSTFFYVHLALMGSTMDVIAPEKNPPLKGVFIYLIIDALILKCLYVM